MITDSVTGKTAVYGIIGEPIGHSFSPIIHNSIADELLSIDMVYVPFHVTKGNLEDAIKGARNLGIQGLNVTLPYKREVIPYLADIDPIARQIGSVNTLKLTDKGYVGYNTDAVGILMSLKRQKVDLKDKNVLILGAGGSAYAAAIAAASHFPAKIMIANRTQDNAIELKEHVAKTYKKVALQVVPLDEIMSIAACDIIIQTTTVGFGDLIGETPLPDTSFFKKAGVSTAFDLIYLPWKTQFLDDAAKSGVKNTMNGFNMLIYQAIASQEIWLGIVHDDEVKDQKLQTLKMYYKSMNNY